MQTETTNQAVLAIRRAVQEAGEDFEHIGGAADVDQIRWFAERLLGWRWPPSYIAVLNKHDGVRFTSPILFSFHESIKVFLVFRDQWYVDRHRWPVGGDGCGSYWVLNLDEQREDGECPVVFIDHEQGPLSAGRFAGNTYADFVVRLFGR
jgi:hypothetical protein